MPVDDREWDQHHREVRHRLSWAGLLSNGALIVALLSGACGADRIQVALQFLDIPLTTFAVGAICGLAGEEFALRADQEWKHGSAWWEDEDGPAKRIVRTHERFRELVSNPSPSLDEAAEAKRLAAATAGLVEKVQTDGVEARGRVQKSIWLNRWATGFRWLSLGLCGAGFVALLALSCA